MPFEWEGPTKKVKTAGVPDKPPAAGPVVFDAVICRLKTMADGGLRVELDLPELSPVEFALLYTLRNKAIKITIKE